MAQQAVRSGRASIKQACLAFSVSMTCYRYVPQLSSENAEIAVHLILLTHNQRNWGFGLCFLYLRNVKGYRCNHKRVYRIYRELNLRIKPRKRIVREKPEPLAVPEAINHCWSMDFLHEQLANGRSFRLFNLIDDFNREVLAMDVDLFLSAEGVVRALNQVIEWRGKPQAIRSDNGPEYISNKLVVSAEKHGIRLEHIQPGNPQQNAYVERYNRAVRYDWLGATLVRAISEVQEPATRWVWTYNHERPNMALGGITPKQKLALTA